MFAQNCLPLLVIGAGNMGAAMVNGWLKSGLDPKEIFILDPNPKADQSKKWQDAGITLYQHYEQLKDDPSIPQTILLAVKPQLISQVMQNIAPHIASQSLIASVAAGISIASITASFGPDMAIVRIMPNMPAQIGVGMHVLCANNNVSDPQKHALTQLMDCSGKTLWIDNEYDMHAVTALSGSGPAYIFLLCELLTKAGIELGLDEAMAAQLARQTMIGSGQLLAHHHDDPEALRKSVTSPGGTTEAALNVFLNDSRAQKLVSQALNAAAQRSKELAELS
jgi:pyrroline-5-carboxylate reductase